MTPPGSGSSGYVDLVRQVLGAQDLRLGPQQVRPFDDEIGRFASGMELPLATTAYVFVTQSLWSTTEEVVLLDVGTSPVSNEYLGAVSRAARELTNLACLTCVGFLEGEGTPSLADIAVPIRYLKPEEFIRSLLSLPRHFAAELEDVARIQQPNEFPHTFQEREARVRTPTGESPDTSLVELSEYFGDWLAAYARGRPILLLGERGSGKSWQLLRVAQQALDLHLQRP